MAALLPLFRHAARAASPVSDAELLDRFAAGRDEDAFAELIRRHGPVVYRVCRRLVGQGAADDAFQAAFLVLATRWVAARAAGSVGGWLVGVAGRVARQMRRAAGRRVRHENAAANARGAAWPDQTLDLTDQFRILDEELARLPDRLRDPVVLCLLQGRTQEQAAAELGRDARTLRRRLERAKQVLRARLESRGVVPAVAAALVAGAGSVSATVPNNLSIRTVATVFDFLTGGPAAACSTPVVLAKGVATTMFTRKIMQLMSVAAAGLLGLGVVLAGDGPPVPPTQSPTAPAAVLAAPPAAGAPANRKDVQRQAADRELVIKAMCIEVPVGFAKKIGLAEDDASSNGPWVLSTRETRMFAALLCAEKAAGELDVLSRPQIAIVDNQTGFFQVGQDVPFTFVEEETKDGKTVHKSTIKYQQTGVTLRVTPKVSADGKFINLRVETQNTQLGEPVRLGGDVEREVRTFNTESMESTVVLPESGTVIVPGGTNRRGKTSSQVFWVLTPHITQPDIKIVPAPTAPAVAPPSMPTPTPAVNPGSSVVPVTAPPMLPPARR